MHLGIHKPVRSAHAFQVHSTLPPQPISQTLFLIFLSCPCSWWQQINYELHLLWQSLLGCVGKEMDIWS